MSREEIALQLTLNKLGNVKYTTYSGKNDAENNAAFGKEIANLYNSIYKNLELNDTVDISTLKTY